MQLQFNVKQQIITLENTDIKVVEKSKNYLNCTFCFCDDWADKIKTAIFISAKGDVFNIILENDACCVPWEVIEYPHFSVSVFGGDLITANKVVVHVIKSGYCEGVTPTDPTPDVYTQIIKMIEEMGGEIDDEVIKQAVEEYLKNNPIEVDPTVPEWAKQPEKPTYTAEEVGTYSKEYLDGFGEQIFTELGGKANYSEVYTAHQVDLKLSEKADKSNTYTKEETKQYVDDKHKIIKADIEGLQRQMETEAHFRGYKATNANIQAIVATPNDFAYSAESGTKWVYDFVGGLDQYDWLDTNIPVPDQLTPASDTTPLINGEATPGQANEYARGDHRHPTDTTRLSVEDFNAFQSELASGLNRIIEIQNSLMGVSE